MKRIYSEKVLDRKTGYVVVETHDSVEAVCETREIRIVFGQMFNEFEVCLSPSEAYALCESIERAIRTDGAGGGSLGTNCPQNAVRERILGEGD